jgi:hypothetical protein
MAKRLQATGSGWFAELLTVNDTRVLTPQDIQEERDAGMSEELIQQEFYCSFDAGMVGAYYTLQLAKARLEGRICNVPVLDTSPVDTYWDLGMDDSTSIWFAQNVGREIHLIDYVEGSGEGLPHYAKVLQNKGYLYGKHFGPHDIKVREVGTGKSRRETARGLGIDFTPTRKVNLKEESIEAVRNIFSQCVFDEKRCKHGIDSLENFRKQYDEKRKVFMSTPVHDWSSHGAAAFETLALNHSFGSLRSRLVLPAWGRTKSYSSSYTT